MAEKRRLIASPPLWLRDGPDGTVLLPWVFGGYTVYSRIRDLRELPQPRYKGER